jgi:ribosome-associated translation inhibitor RaiA
METIQEIKTQIQSLEKSKEYHHEKYLENIAIIDDKITRIERQIEKTKSQVKKELLKRHLDWYEEETLKMDEAIEVITAKIDSQIERLQELITSVEQRKEKEKNSFDFNIQTIRECIKHRSTSNVFNALDAVANALEIIRVESQQT